MKIYISGPITGIKNFEKNFSKAEKKLKKIGHEVVNPVKIGEALNNPSYEDYMKADLKALLECDAIYLLDGWSNSKGANAEIKVAVICGIRIIHKGEI